MPKPWLVATCVLAVLASCGSTNTEANRPTSTTLAGTTDPPRQSYRDPKPKPAPLGPDARADLVEAKLAQLGEKRPVFGAATEPLLVTLSLVADRTDGGITPVFQQVNMVHVVVGTWGSPAGISPYRVGLVADKVTIVLRGSVASNRYQVVWESWPNGTRRPGNPPAKWIEFDE